ncbi:hypothetical protein FRB90_012240, partial [Tulasnella sp. 427]
LVQVYRPHQQVASDAEALRNAKLEAMGIPVPEPRPRTDRKEMATDEVTPQLFSRGMPSPTSPLKYVGLAIARSRNTYRATLRYVHTPSNPDLELFRAFYERLEIVRPELTNLPGLPQIRDPDLRKRVFTHRSRWGRSATLFQDPENDTLPPDNERLEFLGDSILSSVTCTLLHERYPKYRVGPTSKVRSLVISNLNLAKICQLYELQNELEGAPAQKITLQRSEQVQADLFESYIAGVYLDAGDDGFRLVKTWLFQVLDPYVKEAFEVVKKEHLLSGRSPPPYVAEEGELTDQDRARSPSEETGSVVDPGTLSYFNQLCQQKKHKVEWIVTDAPGTKSTPLWKVEVKVNGKIVGGPAYFDPHENQPPPDEGFGVSAGVDEAATGGTGAGSAGFSNLALASSSSDTLLAFSSTEVFSASKSTSSKLSCLTAWIEYAQTDTAKPIKVNPVIAFCVRNGARARARDGEMP